MLIRKLYKSAALLIIIILAVAAIISAALTKQQVTINELSTTDYLFHKRQAQQIVQEVEQKLDNNLIVNVARDSRDNIIAMQDALKAGSDAGSLQVSTLNVSQVDSSVARYTLQITASVEGDRSKPVIASAVVTKYRKCPNSLVIEKLAVDFFKLRCKCIAGHLRQVNGEFKCECGASGEFWNGEKCIKCPVQPAKIAKGATTAGGCLCKRDGKYFPCCEISNCCDDHSYWDRNTHTCRECIPREELVVEEEIRSFSKKVVQEKCGNRKIKIRLRRVAGSNEKSYEYYCERRMHYKQPLGYKYIRSQLGKDNNCYCKEQLVAGQYSKEQIEQKHAPAEYKECCKHLGLAAALQCDKYGDKFVNCRWQCE